MTKKNKQKNMVVIDVVFFLHGKNWMLPPTAPFFSYMEKIGCSPLPHHFFLTWKKLDAYRTIFFLHGKNWMLPAPFFSMKKIEILFHLHLISRSLKNVVHTNVSSRILWSFPFRLDSGYSWYNY
jgi:hypothetical protein